jgi:hypothetical protein
LVEKKRRGKRAIAGAYSTFFGTPRQVGNKELSVLIPKAFNRCGLELGAEFFDDPRCASIAKGTSQRCQRVLECCGSVEIECALFVALKYVGVVIDPDVSSLFRLGPL